MSKPASTTLIGAFVVGALTLLVIGVMIFGSGTLLQKTYPFVMYFESSVTGLSVGSPVVFRGVKVGSVTDITLMGNPATMTLYISVHIRLEPETIQVNATNGPHRRDPYGNMKRLIEQGLRAQLQTQSFVTGQLQIGLDFFPERPAKYVGKGDTAEIPTIPTKLEELAQTLEKLPLEQLVHEVLNAVQGISQVVRDPEIKEVITALKNTAQNLELTVKHADERLGPVLANAEKALEDYGKLARDLDSKLGSLLSRGESAVDDYARLARDLNGQLGPLAKSLEATLEGARLALVNAEKTLGNAQSLTSRDSPLLREMMRSLDELKRATRAIRVFAEYLERHPEALVQGKGGQPRGR
ncbi:MAG: MlaD family protein [Syntrophobacteraceae bacterium]|jgi:paraquat-inducible protein B|nr:MlaD family protein [Syntrophobacteraceae bacterium]